MKSLREDEVAAEVMGVDVRRAKMVSFALSAYFKSFRRTANLTGYLAPTRSPAESASYLLMVVMGGMQT